MVGREGEGEAGAWRGGRGRQEHGGVGEGEGEAEAWQGGRGRQERGGEGGGGGGGSHRADKSTLHTHTVHTLTSLWRCPR